MWRLLARVAALLGLVVAASACGATPSPMSVAEVEIGALEPGWYTYSGFTPRIEVKVKGSGWQTFHRDAEFWDVARETNDGVVALMFLHPPTIIGADGPVAATTAAAAVETLRANHALTVVEERTVEIDGRDAPQLTITVAAENTHMLGSDRALLGIGPSDALRLAFFDVQDGVLVIGTVAQRTRLEPADDLLAPLIATVRIGEG